MPFCSFMLCLSFSIIDVSRGSYRYGDSVLFLVLAMKLIPWTLVILFSPLSWLNHLGCSGQSGHRVPRMNSGPQWTQHINITKFYHLVPKRGKSPFMAAVLKTKWIDQEFMERLFYFIELWAIRTEDLWKLLLVTER